MCRAQCQPFTSIHSLTFTRTHEGGGKAPVIIPILQTRALRHSVGVTCPKSQSCEAMDRIQDAGSLFDMFYAASKMTGNGEGLREDVPMTVAPKVSLWP